MTTIKELLDAGVLITPELVKTGIDKTILKEINSRFGDDLVVIDKKLVDKITNELSAKKNRGVKIIWSYDEPPKKRSYNDFVSNLKLRFKLFENLLKSRTELSAITSFSRLKDKIDQKVSCIGMIWEKTVTKNGHVLLELEDFSGKTKALISVKNEELLTIAKDIQYDEIIGITGTASENIIFVDKIIFPDVPLTKEFKKSPNEEYLLCVGDPHFGSKVFLKKEFERFLLWINGKLGNDEQKKLSKKIKYVIITGDLVEGVGIYPNQENDLEIKDIKKQYEECAKYLKKIPKEIQIILYPGNHDPGRLSEPQEKLMPEYAQALYDLPNITFVSNPAMINLGETNDFPGFDVLVYHGGSFIYYADNIPSIRAAGGQKRSDLIMKYILQRRHIAQTHNAALTIPTTDRDYLFLDQVPDIFVSGHIHRSAIANYRNITMINSSCWTDTTEDQVKRGLEPQPAKLVLLNLKTRAAKLMNFKKKDNVVITRESDKKNSNTTISENNNLQSKKGETS